MDIGLDCVFQQNLLIEERGDWNMPNIPTSEIIVGERMREGLGDIESLARSIEKFGLMQPVVVTPGKELIAGKRRLEAMKLLGWTEVPVRIMEIKETEIMSDDLDMIPVMLRMEIEENRVRKDYVISEKVKIARTIEPYVKKAAEERKAAKRQRSSRKAGGVKKTPLNT